MAAAISFILVLAISILVVRIATMALSLTGLSDRIAAFQARSAFTGTGFTTTESELVVNHPVRRRVVMLLMILRNAGIITAMSSLVLSFTGSGGTEQNLFRLSCILGGVFVLLAFFRNPWVDRKLSYLIQLGLKKWTHLDVRDYYSLLHFSDDYTIVEIRVRPGDWLAEKTLGRLDLPHEGVLILGVQRPDGSYVGAPTGKCRIHAGDTLIVYGRKNVVEDLDVRHAGRSGDEAHMEKVQEHRDVVKTQLPKEK